MLPELLNHNELAAVINAAPVTPDHSELLEVLRARYPDTPFRLVSEREGYSWAPSIIDRAGQRVAGQLSEWTDRELASANGSAREVWRRHKDAGMIRTEWTGSKLYLAVPFGSASDAFQQIEIRHGAEITKSLLFDPSPAFAPEDRGDIISGPTFVFAPEERQVLCDPGYFFTSLVNVRRFLRELVETAKADRLAQLPEMEKKILRVQDITLGPDGHQEAYDIPFLDLCPDWLDRVPSEVRFFQDWQESSAGASGHRLCDHWFIQGGDYTDKSGKRHMSLIPQWADADGGLDLPEIHPSNNTSPFSLVGSLSHFDMEAGYPFAWYFYMLHGNRVTSSAGSVLAWAIKDGLMNPLPECDTKVLLRWHERQYGF